MEEWLECGLIFKNKMIRFCMGKISILFNAMPLDLSVFRSVCACTCAHIETYLSKHYLKDFRTDCKLRMVEFSKHLGISYASVGQLG